MDTPAEKIERPIRTWLWDRLNAVIGLDPRSLAVLRIGLGLTLLLDLAIRATDVRAMYAGDGIYAMEKSIKSAGPAGWSLHWFSGEPWLAWLLLGIAVAFAVGVVLGWRTRWMVVGSFVLLASIHTRNPLILNGGDGMFRVMLFWAIFLPLGTVWSLDARRKRHQGQPPSLKPIVSMATFCFILQLCLVYWFAGSAKLNEVWLGFDPAAVWKDTSLLADATIGGDAMLRAMHYDVYGKPLAGVMAQAPWLLRVVCIGTLFMELIAPIALFIPFGTRWSRVILVGAFAMLHIGIELTLHVGMFSWVSLSAWAALLPAMFWDKRWLKSLSPSLPEFTADLSKQSNGWLWTKFVTCKVLPSAVCAVLMGVTLAWNFSYHFKKDVKSAVQRPIRPIVNATMLRQRWNMFGQPTQTESWFVYRGVLANGKVVDVFHGGQPVQMEKPADLSSMYANHRWRKLNVNLCSKRFRVHREAVADFHCRHWNESQPPERQIVAMQLYRLSEKKDAPHQCSRTLCLTITPDRESLAELAATQR